LDEVAARFAEKMHPLRYQRPQSAPAEGNIAQAEQRLEKLGIARSLERRYARLEEIRTLWKPVLEQRRHSAGIFGQLRAKSRISGSPIIGTTTLTWEKFARIVLPTAQRIEYQVPDHPESFCALITAVHGDAPPLSVHPGLDADSLESAARRLLAGLRDHAAATHVERQRATPRPGG
jgi:hypothetical protein